MLALLKSVSVAAIVFVLVLSSACASKQQSPEPVPSFSTEITADGIKFFTYALRQPERIERAISRRNLQSAQGSGRAQNPSRKQRKRDKEMLEERLETLLAQNGYCRDGYFVLDQYVGPSEATLRGECKEGANPMDRALFPTGTPYK